MSHGLQFCFSSSLIVSLTYIVYVYRSAGQWKMSVTLYWNNDDNYYSFVRACAMNGGDCKRAQFTSEWQRVKVTADTWHHSRGALMCALDFSCSDWKCLYLRKCTAYRKSADSRFTCLAKRSVSGSVRLACLSLSYYLHCVRLLWRFESSPSCIIKTADRTHTLACHSA